ncbi:MAG: hypothetical protein OHK0023_27990 [Anaerolineae bacterium]
MDFLTNPFIVILLGLYRLFGESLVLAIVVFTILSRLATFPLTVTQLRSSKKMREVGPKLQQLREKYKGDREKLAQAQMELYRQEGINPFAGCLPLLIQMPILFGLYGAIYAALGGAPLQFLDLQSRLLLPELSAMVPLKNQFLWMNLGLPDTTFILPALVVATTWLQSKLMMPPTTDPKDPSAAVSRQMTVIMPLLVGLFSISFASGLSVYWIVSNIVGIVQYALYGKNFRPEPAAAPAVEMDADKEKTKRKPSSGFTSLDTSAEPAPVAATASNPATNAPPKPTNGFSGSVSNSTKKKLLVQSRVEAVSAPPSKPSLPASAKSSSKKSNGDSKSKKK